MPFDILACPQCGASLPRQARWRMVNCPSCGSAVTRREDVVQAASFKAAYARARAVEAHGREIQAAGHRYRLKANLGRGQRSEVFLGERIGGLSGQAILKVALPATDPEWLQQEAGILRQMKSTPSLEAGFAAGLLPELEGAAVSDGPEARGRALLILRHVPGIWGSLADLIALHPGGVDPRHVVWMWRRLLGILAILHAAGWAHSDLAPDHLLVRPRDHGMSLAGWSAAHRVTGDPLHDIIRDLSQVAWSMRLLLCGQGEIDRIPSQVPEPLAEFLDRCCADGSWAAQQGAGGLDRLLMDASLKAFGPPAFLAFDPGA